MKRICLGKIVAAHGIKGLVKLFPFGDDASLLGGTLYTSDSGDETFTITLKNGLGKYILAEIEGVTDRTHAENIKGTELYVEREVLPTLDEGFYFEDLVGLKVRSADAQEIGAITAVDDFGAGELLDIRLKTGASFLLPFSDKTVPEVNIEDGYAVIQDYDLYIL